VLTTIWRIRRAKSKHQKRVNEEKNERTSLFGRDWLFEVNQSGLFSFCIILERSHKDGVRPAGIAYKRQKRDFFLEGYSPRGNQKSCPIQIWWLLVFLRKKLVIMHLNMGTSRSVKSVQRYCQHEKECPDSNVTRIMISTWVKLTQSLSRWIINFFKSRRTYPRHFPKKKVAWTIRPLGTQIRSDYRWKVSGMRLVDEGLPSNHQPWVGSAWLCEQRWDKVVDPPLNIYNPSRVTTRQIALLEKNLILRGKISK